MPGLSRLRRCRALRWARARKGQAGFTIVEMMIALVILAMVMLSLAYVGSGSLADVSYASQRQQATGLANKAIEEVRALPFATVENGLSSTDLSSDSNIVACGSNYCYKGEQIPTYTASGISAEPLVPHHQQTFGPYGGVTYTVSAYVTYYDNQTTAGIYRLTVVVTWNHPAVHGLTPQVQSSTLLSTSSGCISTTNQPFAAPCQAFFYGTASDQDGQIDATGDPPGNPPVTNLDVGSDILDLPAPVANLQLEQVTGVQATSSTSGGTIQYTDTTPTASTGSKDASAQASSDPTEDLPSYSSSGTVNQSATTLTASENSNTATVTPTTSDTTSTSATISSGATNVCATEGSLGSTGTITAGTDLTTSEPCANSQVQQQGTTGTVTANFAAGTSTLGTATVGSVAAAPSPTTVAGAFYASAGTGACAAEPASAAGCIHTGAVRSLGTVQLGGLPTGSHIEAKWPSGWAGYLVQLSNYSDSVTAEAGVGAAAPTVTISSAARISYWNGTGYTSVGISTGSGTTLNVSPVTITDSTDFSEPVVITVTPSLQTGGTSVTDSQSGCTSPCTRTTAAATANSPITGNVTYTVTYGGTTVVSLETIVNLGTLSASTNYQPAPSSSGTTTTTTTTTPTSTTTTSTSTSTTTSTTTTSTTTTTLAGLAGLGWTSTSLSGGSLACGSVSQSVTCTAQPLGGTGSFSGKVTLENSSGTAVTNTGSALTVNCSETTVSSPGGTVSPSSSTIANGASASSSAFTLTGGGAGWKATMTCTVVVAGTTYSIAVTGN